MKIGIMGAMPEELSGILALLEQPVPHRIGDREFWEGELNGVEVVAVFSRWGKVAAAATTTVLITRFQVDHVLFIGVAGGADPALDVGDVVVATELLQHDMDVSALPGFSRFEIPLLGRLGFSSHMPFVPKAVAATLDYLEHEFDRTVSSPTRTAFGITAPKVVTGLIASGDRFVTDVTYLADLRALFPDLRCVEMEGGAVAQVCFELDVPLTVVRVISDRADHSAPIDFPRFVAEAASVMTKGIATRFLQHLVQDNASAEAVLALASAEAP